MSNISDNTHSVIITGAFRFPDKDAAAQRVMGIAKALRIENINSIFCGWETTPRIEDLTEEGTYKNTGFDYYSQAELDLESKYFIQKIYRSLFRGRKTIHWIKNYVKKNNVNTIVVYNANSYFIYRLFRLARKKNINYICDCTEWYEGSHLPGGKYGIVNVDNNIRLRFLYPVIRNIIVISSFLETYLKQKGCNTLLIPPIVDMEDDKWNDTTNNAIIKSSNKIKLIYAGDPGKKDLLKSVFLALRLINEKSIQISIDLIGVNKTTIMSSFYSDSKELPTYISCNGRVSHEKVPGFYHQCHFSILLRENKRYANAGFPTKLVESLISAVPVITNSTSDIPKYIKHGENGFLLKNTSTEELTKCFLHILTLKKSEIEKMKQRAKESSRENFDIRLFSKPLKTYFSNLNKIIY
jgi:glycosyltransferase involved in cell wall biosynthesis